jgi:hypothetical protein
MQSYLVINNNNSNKTKWDLSQSSPLSSRHLSSQLRKPAYTREPLVISEESHCGEGWSDYQVAEIKISPPKIWALIKFPPE